MDERISWRIETLMGVKEYIQFLIDYLLEFEGDAARAEVMDALDGLRSKTEAELKTLQGVVRHRALQARRQ